MKNKLSLLFFIPFILLACGGNFHSAKCPDPIHSKRVPKEKMAENLSPKHEQIANKPDSATKDSESTLFSWPAKQWEIGRMAVKEGISYLEIKRKGRWISLMKRPQNPQKRDCDNSYEIDSPGFLFDGDSPLALIFEENSITAVQYHPIEDCVEVWPVLQNDPLVSEFTYLVASAQVVHEYSMPQSFQKDSTSETTNDFFHPAGKERIVTTLDRISIFDANSKLIWDHKTMFHNQEPSCAKVSVSILYSNFANQANQYIKIEEDEFDCVQADSSHERFVENVFQYKENGEFALIYHGESGGSDVYKWGYGSTQFEMVEERYFDFLPGHGSLSGQFIRRIESSSSDSDEDVSIPLEDKRHQSIKCVEPEAPAIREKLSSSNSHRDWILKPKGKSEIRLHRKELEPPKKEQTKELICSDSPI